MRTNKHEAERYARRSASRRDQKRRARQRRSAPAMWNCPYFVTTRFGVFMAKRNLADLISGQAPNLKGPAASDDALEEKCPLLHLLMTSQEDDKGKKRKVCSLSIFAGDGVWKASLNERDKGLVLWASADSLATLPEALEALLNETPIPWRANARRG